MDLVTKEGPVAVKEAIEFLNLQEPVGALEWSDYLWQASRDHTKDIGPKGLTGHDGSNGSSSKDRLNKYGKFLAVCGENLSFGSSTA